MGNAYDANDGGYDGGGLRASLVYGGGGPGNGASRIGHMLDGR